MGSSIVSDVTAEQAEHPAPNRSDHVFDIHPVVHLTLAAGYLAFVGILATAFMGPDLVIPTAIFVFGITALFGTPALWARVSPKSPARRQSWSEFREEGVDCLTGPLTTTAALAQILVLPGLMICLAAVIALVRFL